jgi:hypothetical protein
MKKLLQLFFGLIIFGGLLNAQTPQFFNTNVAGGANAFPLGSTTSSKVQWTIPAGSLGTVTAGNNITRVYFQSGSNATNTYPIINVRLKTGTTAGLTGTAAGPFETGMTLVYSGTAAVITNTVGQWFGFLLSTPFLYNPALPLLVELEQNATTANQTVYQALTVTGPGNGRQWGLFGGTTITGVGTQQVNFGIDVLPATPCTAPPGANTVLPLSFTTCPGISNPTIGIANTYTDGGITYQWQSSTVSPIGPFTPISNATLSSILAPTLGVTTWFQVIATCTNPGGGSTFANANQFVVAGTTSNTAPYNEDFDGLQINNRLPNCSWFYPANLGTTLQTYTTSATSNRVPRSGTSFGAFSSPTNSNNAVYSSAIWLDAGVNYSATLWYQTDLTGATNWSNLSLSIGNTQTSSSQSLIASSNGPAVSIIYKPLTNVFTVPSSGLYFVEIKATASSGGAPFLVFDDLSITKPCSINTPTVNAVANSTIICQGSPVIINASGANTYSWNTGATTSSLSNTPLNSTQYVVTGTSSLSGCSSNAVVNIIVNPSPFLIAFSATPFVCLGSFATIIASGASNYAWSNSTSGAVTVVSPTSNTTYTVIGTNTNNCSGSAVVSLTVRSLPVLNIGASNTQICANEKVDLIASGANSFLWVNNSNSLLYSGANISPILTNVGIVNFTVTGKDNNECESSKTISLTVSPCTGINEANLVSTQISVYPNPAFETINIALNSDKVELIQISDLFGRTLNSIQPEGKVVSVNLSTFANGVYFVKAVSNEKTEIIKFIKE